MKKYILLVLLVISNYCASAQWVTVNPTDIDAIQYSQSINAASAAEGIYVILKFNITGDAATFCPRKDFIIITDQKLADRFHSVLLFSISTQKTIKFYLDGPGKCAYNGPIATSFTLVP